MLTHICSTRGDEWIELIDTSKIGFLKKYDFQIHQWLKKKPTNPETAPRCDPEDLMVSQHWIRQWFGVILHKAITWPKVDWDLPMPYVITDPQWVISLWPSDVIWWQGSRSTLAQVMACCLMATSHYLNQCWLIISEVLWHSPDSNFTERIKDIYRRNEL